MGIPKTGQRSRTLEAKGKEPLLKVGAVCCNCGAEELALCKSRKMGIRLVQPNQDEIEMTSDTETLDVQTIVKWTMGQLGFIKGEGSDAEEASKKEEKGKGDAKKT